MDYLDRKLNDAFPGFVVRRDLVKLVCGNAAVPIYVFEDVEKRIQQQIEDDGLRTCRAARDSISSELVPNPVRETFGIMISFALRPARAMRAGEFRHELVASRWYTRSSMVVYFLMAAMLFGMP